MATTAPETESWASCSDDPELKKIAEETLADYTPSDTGGVCVKPDIAHDDNLVLHKVLHICTKMAEAAQENSTRFDALEARFDGLEASVEAKLLAHGADLGNLLRQQGDAIAARLAVAPTQPAALVPPAAAHDARGVDGRANEQPSPEDC